MVNPVMMQPKTVGRYAGMVDTIAEDFIARIRSIRDDKREVPGDFGNEMNKWALESVAYIAMDQRLGLLTDTDPESAGQKLIQVSQRRREYFKSINVFNFLFRMSTTFSICRIKWRRGRPCGSTTRPLGTTS